jgi:hypothetical protein
MTRFFLALAATLLIAGASAANHHETKGEHAQCNHAADEPCPNEKAKAECAEHKAGEPCDHHKGDHKDHDADKGAES